MRSRRSALFEKREHVCLFYKIQREAKTVSQKLIKHTCPVNQLSHVRQKPPWLVSQTKDLGKIDSSAYELLYGDSDGLLSL